MALTTRPKAPGKPSGDTSASSPLTFALQESEGIVRAPRGSTKHEAYPQVVAAVAQSLAEKKAFKFAGLGSKDAVRQARNMLAQARNAYVDRGEPIQISQTVTDANGAVVSKELDGALPFTLHFQAKSGAREYQYTAKQIREWHAKQPRRPGDWDGKGKIPLSVREAFKEANGFAKTK